MPSEKKKKKQAIKITDKGIIAKLEYENKILRGSLLVSSIITSVLASTLTFIVLSNIRG